MQNTVTLEKITALSKRRGFIYPSSELYGGLANTYDWGPYGAQLKKNIADYWWRFFVESRSDVLGLDASIILNPKIWEASGHTQSFSDAMVDCKQCKTRMRADHLIEEVTGQKVEGKAPEALTQIIIDNGIACPHCGAKDFTPVRQFNLLFETHIGILEESQSRAYLRGEIAQGIFVNYKNVIDSVRVPFPFGIAQMGKAFRNEITKGKLVHRTLEFDLMEFEYFVKQGDWEKLYDYWQKVMWQFVQNLGVDKAHLRWRKHEVFERSFYSSKTMDIEYLYPFGWAELFGLAYRSDYDLKNHMEKSGIDLRYEDKASGEKFIPHVIEPTFGLSRLTGVLLYNAYHEESVNDKTRVVMQFAPYLAPIKLAVFPLQKDDKLVSVAEAIFQDAKDHFACVFDNAGNIGKMYRRQDEIGTPWCVTVDYQTLEDQTVTLRDRDTLTQIRLNQKELVSFIKDKIAPPLLQKV